MKIYISVDMEGISGITSKEHVSKDERLYTVGQRLATGDVNAAVRGAFDAGADEVIVADMHASSGNLLTEQIDPRATVLAGTPHQPRFPFLDSSVDGMFLVGYHAMAGTLGATLEHTMTSQSWHRICINGRPYGELGIDSALAAEAGVPVVMVSGDDKLCDEAHAWLGNVEAACVKQGLGRHSALCLSPEQGQKKVYQAAYQAVGRLLAGERFVLPETPSPAFVAITYKHSADADAAAGFGARRLDGYTVEKTLEKLSAMYGGIWEDYGIAQRVRGEKDS